VDFSNQLAIISWLKISTSTLKGLWLPIGDQPARRGSTSAKFQTGELIYRTKGGALRTSRSVFVRCIYGPMYGAVGAMYGFVYGVCKVHRATYGVTYGIKNA
jgi:hypothetical protein